MAVSRMEHVQLLLLLTYLSASEALANGKNMIQSEESMLNHHQHTNSKHTILKLFI